MPDPLIEKKYSGIGLAPAYRGLAYIVIENLNLKEFGNRLPNFIFEVKKRTSVSNLRVLEDNIESVVMIPGSGEFVYDTVVQKKITGTKNHNT
ncbi:MAG: hypothetical protein MRQ07_02785 [Candidatus Midichloria sp.]|nr:hypothetical protein [Candidatus Midichloria sp.]